MAIKKWKNKKGRFSYKALVMHERKWMRSKTWSRKIDAEREERNLFQLRDSGANSNLLAPMPVTKATELWLEDVERRCGYARTQCMRQYIVNHFLPHFRDKDIKKLKPSDVSLFVSALKKKDITADTINSIIKALKAMFNFHIEEDNMLRNIVKKKHLIYEKAPKEEQVVWTLEEGQRFLKNARVKYADNKEWVYLLYQIAMNTGMRLGEIIALERSDFDFENSRILISKNELYRTGEIKVPKNGKVRRAPFPPNLQTSVREYMIKNRIFGPLFIDSKGKYFSRHTIRNCHWLKDIDETGVPYTKFHNLRRFYSMHFLESGGNEVQLRKIVGHASKEMTDLYTVQRNNMSKLANLVNL